MKPAPVPLTLTLTLALALAPAAPAQPPPDIRYVTHDKAEVRCGPSTDPQLYPTNVLSRGDAVEVVEQRPDGWLAIRPPRNSFSWINTRFLQHIVPNQPNWVVALERVRVPVLVGSEVNNSRPTVVGARVERGTQVRSIGPTQADEEGTWMPIEPPPGEVRYIRAEVVAKTPPAPAPAEVVSAGANDGTASAGRIAPVAAPETTSSFIPAPGAAAPPPTDPEAVWRLAQQAERAGNIPEAIRLYTQAGTDLHTNPRQALEARNRAHYLREASRTGTAGEPRYPAPPSVVRYSSSPANGSSPPASDPPAPVRLGPPPGSEPPPRQPSPAYGGAPPSPGQPNGWGLPSSGRGWLRRAGRAVESQRTYVLEASNGAPLLYVTPQPGVDLEPYVNRNVELAGPAVYRGDLRANYMTVTRVQPLP
jgi:hypothetical protein